MTRPADPHTTGLNPQGSQTHPGMAPTSHSGPPVTAPASRSSARQRQGRGHRRGWPRRPDVRVDARMVAEEAWQGIRRHTAMTVAVVVTVAVSLTLLGAALLLSSQVKALKGYWYDKVEVSVFLCGPTSAQSACPTGKVTDPERQRVKDTLDALPVTKHVYYESTAQALERFRAQYRDSQLVDQVDVDTMPESYRVKLTDPTQFTAVADAVGKLPGVESVSDQRALLKKFFSVVSGLQGAALALAATQVLVAAILVANTVRTAAFARRRQVQIMRLVGASKAMVRAPFLAENALAGLCGSLLAAGSLALVKSVLIDRRLADSASYLRYITWSDYARVLPVLVAVGVVLPVAATAWSLRRHLR